MSQSSSPFIREEIENLLNKRAVERVQNLGTPGFYSRIFLVPKKNGKLRLIIDISLLNQYIKKVFQNGDSQVGETSDETQRLGCLHRLNRCIPTRSNTSSIPEVSSFRSRRSGLSLHGLTVRNRALEILKSESVQPMMMTSSMSPFSKKKICIYHLSQKLMTMGSPITPFK